MRKDLHLISGTSHVKTYRREEYVSDTTKIFKLTNFHDR